MLLNLTSCTYDKTVVTLGSGFDSTWDFSSNSGYDYDPNYVEIRNGKAQLKALDLEHSGADFNNGTHVGSHFLNGNLKMLSEGVNDKINIHNILPTQSNRIKGYWRFDGNWSDSSSNEANGSPEGDASISSANFIFGESSNFDGTNTRVAISELSPVLTDEFSYSFWVRVNTDLVTWQGILGGTTLETRMPSAYIRDGSKVSVAFGDGVGTGTQCVLTTTNDYISLGSWFHVGISFKKGLGTKIYINGAFVEDITTCKDQDLLSSQVFFIQQSNNMDGNIDELAFFDTQLENYEIYKVYKNQSQNFTELSSTWTPKWDSVVGYWKMDGNWQDSSGNGNHGLAVGDTTHTNVGNKIGSHSSIYDGVGDYLQIPSDSTLDITQGTWGGWFKITSGSISNQGVLMEKPFSSHTSPFYDYGIYFRKTENDINCFANISGSFTLSDRIIVNGDIENSEWRHILCSYDGSNFNIYLNGILRGSIVAAGSLISTPGTSLQIGKQFNVGSDNANLIGEADDIALWNKALSTSDVSLIYNRQKQKYAGHYDSEIIDLGGINSSWPDLSWSTNLPFGKELVGDFDNGGNPDSETSSDYFSLSGDLSNGLVGYWNFNESTLDSAPDGHDFADLSGSGNFLFESGGVFLNNAGKVGSSVAFDGVDDYIDFQEQAAIQLGFNHPFSLSLWIKFPSKQVDLGHNTNRILDRRGATSAHTFAVYNENAADEGKVQYNFNDGITNNNLISNAKINDNKYHFVSITYDSSIAKVYIDGNLDNQLSISGTSVDDLTDLRLGNQTTGFIGLNAFVDELSIWNRELNESEIQQLYRRGANRVKIQVKSCVDSNCECKSLSTSPVGSATDCDGDTIVNALDFDDIHIAEFIGPGGDGTTYYSELYNRQTTDVTFSCALNTTDSNPGVCVEDEITFAGGPKPTGPEFLNIDYAQFVNPGPNRYAQYRVYMEADDNTACGGEPCLPELSSVSLNPSGVIKYASDYVEVKPSTPITFTRIARMTIQADSCAKFRLARGGTQYYYDSGVWIPVSAEAHMSPASDLENNILQFASQFGPGELEVIGYLKSDAGGSTQCRIDEIDVGYK